MKTFKLFAMKFCICIPLIFVVFIANFTRISTRALEDEPSIENIENSPVVTSEPETVEKVIDSPVDVSTIIKLNSLKVKQNDNLVDVLLMDENDTFSFSYSDPFSLEVNFNVPVNKGVNKSVKHGDYANILIANNLNINNSLINTPLPMTITDITHPLFSKTLGHVTLQTRNNESTKELFALIEFNADQDFFTNNAYDVNGTFKYDFNFSGQRDIEEYQETFTLFKKTFTVSFPPIETIFTLNKSAKYSEINKVITWNNVIARTQNETHYKLDGLTFKDDLTTVGEYVEGSFKIDNTSVTPIYNNGILTYSFLENSGKGPKVITFDTKVTKEQLINEKTFNNTSNLLEYDNVVASGNATIKPKIKWIYKYGIYDSINDKCNFFIEFNKYSYKFDKLFIHESKLYPSAYIDSASYVTGNWDTDTSKYIWDESSIKPISFYDDENKTFLFENINSAIRLQVSIKEDLTDSIDPNRINNTAEISLDGKNSFDSHYASIYKLNGFNLYKNISNISNHGTHNISLNLYSEQDDFVFYDMIAYSELPVVDNIMNTSNVSIDQVIKTQLINKFNSGIGNYFLGKMNKPTSSTFGNRFYDNGNLVVKEIISEVGKKVPTFGKTLTHNIDYTFSLHPVYSNSNKVGELVRVHFNKKGHYYISFETTPTDPIILAGNFDTNFGGAPYELRNKAYIVHEDIIRADTSASNIIYNTMLDKDTLSNTISEQNTFSKDDLCNIATSKTAYNYDGNTILYRLSINQYGRDTFDTLGKIMVEDTLPIGATLKEFTSGEYFQIYKATSSVNSKKDLININPIKLNQIDGVDHIEMIHTPASFDDKGTPLTQEKISFSFNHNYNGGIFKLNDPYIILLKVELCEHTLNKFTLNMDKNWLENNVKLIIKDFTSKVDPDVVINVDYHDIIAATSSVSSVFDFNIIKKSHDYNINNKGILVNWEIHYDPYYLSINSGSLKIKDIIPQGIELPRSANGKLNYSMMKLVEVQSNDVNRKIYSEIPNTEIMLDESNIQYDPITRIMYISIPNGRKTYAFHYCTYITGDSNTKINNIVELEGINTTKIETSSEFVISNSSARASMKMGESFIIKKVDLNKPNNYLSGAKFTLYSSNNKNEKIRIFTQNTTDDNGIIKFIALPIGKYILEEDSPPKGYLNTNISYLVDVSSYGSIKVTNLNNKNKNLLNNNILIVTNINKDDALMNINVTKLWDNNNSKNNTFIEVDLYRGLSSKKIDEYVKTIVIRKDDMWKYTFNNLPTVEKNTLKAYYYTIKEKPIEGFNSSIQGDMNTGFSITNTFINTVNEISDEQIIEEPIDENDSTEENEPSNNIVIEENTNNILTPQTGDNSPIRLYTLLTILSLISIWFITFNKNKNEPPSN